MHYSQGHLAVKKPQYGLSKFRVGAKKKYYSVFILPFMFWGLAIFYFCWLVACFVQVQAKYCGQRRKRVRILRGCFG